MMDTSTPFKRLNGTTANITNVNKLSICPFTLVPISIKLSIGMWNAVAYVGNKTYALTKHPRMVINRVPTTNPIIAPFFVLFLL